MSRYDTCTPIQLHDAQLMTFAFDGCFYYFVYCDRVIKTDMSLQKNDCFQVARGYHHLCYDQQDRCFWAMSNEDNSMLYALDMNFQECDCIPIQGLSNTRSYVTGMTYDLCENQILVAMEHSLVRVAKNGDCCKCIRFKETTLLGIASLSPGCILYAYGKNGYTFQVLKPNGKRHELCPITQGVQVLAMVIDVCCEDQTYTLRYIAIGDEFPLSLCELALNAQMLGYQPCKCNFQCCRDDCSCEKQVVHCHSVLASIAMEEAAIAHILNAEGEKIQKAVSISTDIDAMLCVNDSVNETIVNATALEQTLYAKLMAIMKLCMTCQNDTCCSNPKDS